MRNLYIARYRTYRWSARKSQQTDSGYPENHKDLWNRSVPDPQDPKTRWAIEGSGRKTVTHRFQSNQKDGSGPFHWNGSTNAATKSGKKVKFNATIPKL